MSISRFKLHILKSIFLKPRKFSPPKLGNVTQTGEVWKRYFEPTTIVYIRRRHLSQPTLIVRPGGFPSVCFICRQATTALCRFSFQPFLYRYIRQCLRNSESVGLTLVCCVVVACASCLRLPHPRAQAELNRIKQTLAAMQVRGSVGRSGEDACTPKDS